MLSGVLVARLWVVLMLLLAWSCASTDALTQTLSPACARPEARQMDFFVGDWSLAWSSADGRAGRAGNTVVIEGGGCVVREHFVDARGELEGTGIYTYFAPAQAWVFYWMDNQGVVLTGRGGFDEASGFVFQLQRGPDPARQYRIVFDGISDAGFVWRFQSRAGEEDWRNETVSRYRREARAQ
jgi:hypothetical protein